MSFWANVFWADVFWANVVLSKCLWAYLSGQMSYGKMSGHRSTVHLFQNYEMEAKVDEEPVMKKQNATFTIGQLSNAAMYICKKKPCNLACLLRAVLKFEMKTREKENQEKETCNCFCW
jgi:hypothetical protein